MLWRCDFCGSEFPEPYRHRYRENLDGECGIQECCDLLCPDCGSDEIEELFESDGDIDNDTL